MSRRKRLRANVGVLLVLMAFGAFLLATQLRYIPLSEQGRVGLLIHPSVGFILPFGEFRLFDNPETTGFGCRGRSSTNR